MSILRDSIHSFPYKRVGAHAPYDVQAVSASILILAMPFALPRAAQAEPDLCTNGPANVITCSGDQSGGVVREAVPPIDTLRVRDLDEAVAPGTGDGIRMSSTRGGNLNVHAGSATEVIDIETHGDDARGILVDSVGQPAPPADDPFLGVPLPGSPNVSGGVVTIENFGSIATDGYRSYGIAGASSTSGYPAAMIDELERYQGAGIAFALTEAADPGDPNATPLVPDPVNGATLAGRVAIVEENADGLLEFVEYAGTAGEFTLFGDGRFEFEPGDDFDDLAVGESRSVSVLVTVDGYRDGGAPKLVGESGELVAVVTKTAEGTNGAADTFEVATSARFETFGTSTRPADENLVWPDVASYVHGLAADAQGAGGAGNSVIVRHLAGEITTRGAAAHGIVAESRGQAGGRGDDGGGFFTFGLDEPTGGGDGNFGGDVTVRADGTITIEHELELDPNVDLHGLASAGVFAHSQGGQGGRGGDGGTYYYGRQGGAGGSGALVEVEGSGTITTAGHYGVGILALSEGGDGGDGGAGAELTGGAPGGAGGVAGNVDVHGDWNITTRGDEAYGIWAKSVGGDAGTGGSGGWLIGAPGGGGVGSNGGDVALVSGGRVETFGADAFALFGQSVGGFGGSGGRGRGIFYSRGGSGDSAGSGGDVTVINGLGGELATHGTGAHALVALSVGGGGGAGGGSAGVVAVGGSGASGGHGGVATANNFGSIATFGDFARGMHAQSVGGGGGDGGSAGGLGAIGGMGSGTSDGDEVLVTNTGTIETGAVDENGAVVGGAWSEAIFAQSIGGGGGSGGSSAGWFSIGGGGGGGGNGDKVTVANSGALHTRGADASAIVAQSVGGGGGSGGNSVAVGGFGNLAIGGHGAAGGKGGAVSVTSADGAIETLGDRARGIDAQSVGGGGGRGGFAISAAAGPAISVSIGVGGDAGGGGDADLVNVTNASAIRTAGIDAQGLFAQSIGGGGGSGGFSLAGAGSDGVGVALSFGGSGGSGGDGKRVEVANGGEIDTTGLRSVALFAQSIGGGGGNGGFSIAGSGGGLGAFTLGVGGEGGGGGNSAEVDVTSTAAITTRGHEAHGLQAQSVGGGGGNGGFSIGAAGGGVGAGTVTIGGRGAGGGDGSAVTVRSSGRIETGSRGDEADLSDDAGDGAIGLFAQSVGGGGGNGGFSIAGAGAGTGAGTLSFGGAGAGGGDSGTVDVVNDGEILTHGVDAHALLAQSIGGGGGNGGFTITGAGAGTGAGTLSLGGSAGPGGDSRRVRVETTGTLTTEKDRAIGLFAQSVGGGGGTGGFSIAGSGAGTGAGSLSLGGSGGGGGNGGEVEVDNRGRIETAGVEAYGLFAQSVGGGGGRGGFIVSGSGATTFGGTVSLGAKGGAGGDGLGVAVTNAGTIETAGASATVLLAQSVGGGGGNGGFSVSGALGAGGASLTVGGGGPGDGGGDAATVAVTNTGNLLSVGDAASGVLAQSVGGGGGNGGFSITGSMLGAQNANVTVGGAGGRGGAGGNVAVDNRGNIATAGKESHGIRAESTSDGGGNGGFALSGSFGGAGAKNIGVTVGGAGGDGNRAGDVAVGSTGTIATAGEAAHGVFATSIGGGGGNGGASIGVGFGIGGEKSWNANLSVSVGGGGGDGGEGGAVRVGAEDAPVQGEIRTGGDDSHGIYAQSIGGGGGNGGSATAINIDVDRPQKEGAEGGNTLSASVAVGGGGGNGNKASTVDVVNASVIATLGAQSHGIYAQSIGGGGGNGGRSAALSLSTSDLMPWKETQGDNYGLDVSVGGGGGDGNTGGAVTVRNSGDISTAGALSRGIVAQSIGGGGGSGAQGILGSGVDWLDDALDTLSPLQMAFELKGLVEKPKDALPKSATISVGGDGGSSADAAQVRVENAGTITTAGMSAHAIFAQSIGGGGGEAQLYARGTGEGAEAAVGIGLLGEIAIAGKGGIAGDGADVDIVHTGRLETAGHAASGIFAQSIGGGGGQAGSISGGFADLSSIGLGLAFGQDGGSAGNGGNVTVESGGEIVTTGEASVGVFAQSVGGGGGIIGDVGGIAFAGSVGGHGAGGAVTVRHAGDVRTLGAAAHGIMAQSIGGGADGEYSGRGGAVAVTIDGTVDVAGADANGVLAQSLGLAGNGDVTVTIADGAVVRGGTGSGTGVRLLDGGANRVTNRGTVEARSGLAIAAAAGDDTVENHGRVIGNVDLGAGTNRFVNGAGAELLAGDSIVVGAGNALENSGLVSPGGASVFAHTVVDGDFEQLEPGALLLDLDVRRGAADFITVTGGARLDGNVALATSQAEYAVPGEFRLPILSAAALDAASLSLAFAQSAVAQYELAASATELALEYSVDFSAAGLGPNQAALGDYVNAVQVAGGSSAFAPIAAHLFGLPDEAALAAAYEELSPDVHGGIGSVALSAAAEFGDAMMSCPTVTADVRFGLEDDCNWIRLAARDLTHDRTEASPGFTERTSGLSGGVQRQVADDLYVGFALAYENSRLHSGTRYDSDGERYQAGFTLKRNANRNTLALGVSTGFGSYDSARIVSLPLADTRLTSEQALRYVALRGRFAHTVENGGAFVRPLIDLQLTRTHVGSFTEQGLGTTNLAVGSQRHTHFVVNPAVELGAELRSSDGSATQLFGRIGAVRYPSGVTPSMDASFVAAPPGIAPFPTSNRMDRTFVELAFGVSLLESDGMDLRFEVAGQFGENSRQRSGQLKLTMPVGGRAR